MRGPTFAVASSAVLLALLALPLARMPFMDAAEHRKNFAKREKHPPARFELQPLTPIGLRKNLRKIESWFADWYGFRTELIALKTGLYLAVGLSPRENQVILGRDGWLSLGNGHSRIVDKTSGRLLFTRGELDAYAANLEEKRQVLAASGAQLMVFVVPEKHTVYPERLPVWARKATGVTMTGQLAERLHGTDVVFTDLSESLKGAREKKTQPLYYKTDTHWNQVGAFEGYRRIMSVIGEHYPEVRTLEELPYEETAAKAGDLAELIGVPAVNDVVYTPVLGPEFGALSLGGDCRQKQGQNAAKKKRRSKGDPRPNKRPRDGSAAPRESNEASGFLTVNPNHCKSRQAAMITGSGLERTPRVLVLGDSFTMALSPYLNQSFESVIYTHYNNAKENGQLMRYVDRHQPDLVVLVMVERFLNQWHPSKDRQR